jgi:hypothetical protein
MTSSIFALGHKISYFDKRFFFLEKLFFKNWKQKHL